MRSYYVQSQRDGVVRNCEIHQQEAANVLNKFIEDNMFPSSAFLEDLLGFLQ